MTKWEHLEAAIGGDYAEQLVRLAGDLEAAERAIDASDFVGPDADRLIEQRRRLETLIGSVLQDAVRGLDR